MTLNDLFIPKVTLTVVHFVVETQQLLTSPINTLGLDSLREPDGLYVRLLCVKTYWVLRVALLSDHDWHEDDLF